MNVPFLNLKKQYETIRAEIEPAVLGMMESCSYIGGRYVTEFENATASYLQTKYAIGCANGTDALILALRACGVKPGDEVITTAFTFFATAEAIAVLGAIPVFVDVKQNDFTLDPALIEEKITERTTVILPVHIFGTPCDIDQIKKVADKYQLKVVEDAAQAIGCTYKGRMVGGISDITCFSFYPTKNLGCFGDGGMVTTENADLAVILLALREHGAAQNGARARSILEGVDDEFQTTQKSDELYNPYKYFNYLVGYNSRLDAIQAAILTVKLRRLPEYTTARAELAQRYSEGLCGTVITPSQSPYGVHCFHQYAIRTDAKDQLCAFLSREGIGVGTFYPVPLHLQKAFTYLGYQEGDLPVTEMLAKQTVCLPIFPELTEDEADYVIQKIKDFFKDRK